MDQCKVWLMSMTENPIDTIVLAIMACRNGDSFEKLGNKIIDLDLSEKKDLIHRVMKMGHMSVIEHVSFTFLIERISRSCSHQVVRQRLATFSQESQRAVDVADMDPIVPDSIKNSSYRMSRFEYAMLVCKEVYRDLVGDGTPLEDSRYVLPNATPTKMEMTFNAREMYHIFDVRLCLCAENEIRSVVGKMKELVQDACPELFPEDMIGPTCLSEGRCFQGNKKCRRYQEIAETGKAIR